MDRSPHAAGRVKDFPNFAQASAFVPCCGTSVDRSMDIQLRRGFRLRPVLCDFGGQVDGQGSPHAAGLA
jgi:hypothetical protein